MQRGLRTSLWAVAVCTLVWALGSVDRVWSTVGAAALTAFLMFVIEQREGPDGIAGQKDARFTVEHLCAVVGIVGLEANRHVFLASDAGLQPMVAYYTCQVGADPVLVLEAAPKSTKGTV